MSKVLLFITNNYVYFLLAALFLIISTVGYVVEEKKEKLDKAKEVPTEEKKAVETKTKEKKK